MRVKVSKNMHVNLKIKSSQYHFKKNDRDIFKTQNEFQYNNCTKLQCLLKKKPEKI